MEKGEIFKREIRIKPVEDGSFVLTSAEPDRGMSSPQWAFSNIRDLMGFLRAHSEAEEVQVDVKVICDHLQGTLDVGADVAERIAREAATRGPGIRTLT